MKTFYIFALTFLLISLVASKKHDFSLGDKLKQTLKTRFNLESLKSLGSAKNSILEKLKEFGLSKIHFKNVESYLDGGMKYKINFDFQNNSKILNGVAEILYSLKDETFNIQNLSLQQDDESKNQVEDSSTSELVEYQPSDENIQDSSSYMKENTEDSDQMENVEHQSPSSNTPEEQYQNEQEEDQSSNEENAEGENQRLIGGWEEYEIKENYLSDPYSTLNIAHVALAKNLEEKGFQLRKIIKAESQLVNGVNMKLRFIYSSDGALKLGNCVVYIPFNNDSAKVTGLEFQSGTISHSTFNNITPINFVASPSAGLVGGYRDVDIDPKLLADPQSSLYKVNQQLEKELIERGFTLSRIFRLQIQLVNGFNYKVDFQYNDGPSVKTGRAVIYISFDQKTISLTSFELFKEQSIINQ